MRYPADILDGRVVGVHVRHKRIEVDKTEVVAATKAGVAAIWLRRLRRESLSIVFLIVMSASMTEANYRLAMPPK
ncbi:MAG TPA: hypothetical protein VGI40_28745 [Pirellulaceae bacterium]